MRVRKSFDIETGAAPQTRSELHQWVRDRLHLPAGQEQALLDAIDSVFMMHERLWQQSKHEAIQAVSAGFTDRLNRLRDELSARDATVSSIARYFEDLVADLTDRVHRDPKTRLMNFRRFIEQVEAFLALEQRGRWCAIGLVDINSFKWYNDTLGHAAGDKIIDRVARLLREQVRSDDLIRAGSGRRPRQPGPARTLRRGRVLLPHPRSRRMPRCLGDRRAVPAGGRTVRLDCR
jgi:GGDEF domain-containing protein